MLTHMRLARMRACGTRNHAMDAASVLQALAARSSAHADVPPVRGAGRRSGGVLPSRHAGRGVTLLRLLGTGQAMNAIPARSMPPGDPATGQPNAGSPSYRSVHHPQPPLGPQLL